MKRTKRIHYGELSNVYEIFKGHLILSFSQVSNRFIFELC